jgi:protein-S-isoprenylcysteine O-methyltransferase Ste14
VLGKVAGAAIAVLAVSAASVMWRIPQAYGPQAVLAVYVTSLVLLAIGGLVVFRLIVRRCCRRQRRLTPFPFFLQLLLWGHFMAFPCIYNPFSWAWSQPDASQCMSILAIIGWSLVWIGLLTTGIAMGTLGLPRSFGQGSRRVQVSGLYRVTRNPQLLGGLLLVIGYAVLWPSWYALGWVALYAFLAHMMVLTEEDFLLQIHGEHFREYCRRVPRYIGITTKS